MPLYDYQCGCGLRFEASASMAKALEPSPCPECKTPAPRIVPEDVSGSFNQPVTGPGPQNTGLASLDANIDRVIGQSAQKGWAVADKRVKDKRRVLAETPGATGADLSRNPDGTYRVLAPEEKGVHDRANAINRTAMQKLQDLKSKKPQA